MDGTAFRVWARQMYRKSNTLYEDALIAAAARIHDLTAITCNVWDFAWLGVTLLNPFEAVGR